MMEVYRIDEKGVWWYFEGGAAGIARMRSIVTMNKQGKILKLAQQLVGAEAEKDMQLAWLQIGDLFELNERKYQVDNIYSTERALTVGATRVDSGIMMQVELDVAIIKQQVIFIDRWTID
jgi:hypothetical protein